MAADEESGKNEQLEMSTLMGPALLASRAKYLSCAPEMVPFTTFELVTERSISPTAPSTWNTRCSRSTFPPSKLRLSTDITEGPMFDMVSKLDKLLV